MAFNGIYGYYDKKNQQMMYIGQSNDIERRHRDHIKPSRYNEQVVNRVLQNNPERYELVIIKSRPGFSKEDRDILEKHYIEFYNTFADDKFNFTTGGDGGLFSEETRKKISEALKGENNPMYGKTHSAEARKKISEARKGKKNYFYGKHLTEKHKKKISEALKGENNPNYGKKNPELSKRNSQNIGPNNPFYGKHHSEEIKRKMSLSRNSTGYRRVSLVICPDCKSGKKYRYRYYNDDGNRKEISSVNLEKLKEKVLEKGLPWEKLN